MKGESRVFLKEFFLRALVAMGFGPIVLGIVYLILSLTGQVEVISATEVALGILTIAALAFICGGMTAIYQVESLPLPIKILLHGLVLYVSYAVIYLVNGWLESSLVAFLVFSGIFVATYILTWIIVFVSVKINTKKINERIDKT